MATEFEADFSSTPIKRGGSVGILARYRGRCPACDQPIRAEVDYITFVALDINNYVHVECAADAASGSQPYSDPKPNDFCPICWQARAANGTCGCL